MSARGSADDEPESVMAARATIHSCRSVCLVALALSGCSTAGSDAQPPPIFSEPSLTPVEEPRRPPAAPAPAILLPPPPPVAPAFAEELKPVRGGAKALPPYLGPDPCHMALTGESPVAKACSEGGERRAIDLMQLFVKRAQAEGFHFKCATCHIDEDDRTRLAPNADAEFRKLLFLARPGD
jgi:hypothetical protein